MRALLACVCRSDLQYYRGLPPHAVGSIGHDHVADAYAAMDERRAIKALIRVGAR